ncbi:S8 family serine peptidase [uncultured Methylobacterium sp.]|uniref:S8 family peptidase n=1 Tax=uncultured Methylobacterium sp. TaxID=157278 RepID=UPI0026307C98|nr:S8 family serine peptidase [uncultured Methylobacterium sp.]
MHSMPSNSDIPEYHTGMLLVRTTKSPLLREHGAMTAAFASDALRDSLLERAGNPPAASGLAAIGYFERAGLIRKVTPIRPPSQPGLDEALSFAATSSGFGATAALMAAALAADPDRAADDPTSGMSLIEFERDEDRDAAQRALGADPGIATVSRVPVRYLAARKARRTHAQPAAAALPPPPATMWNLRKIQWQQARALPNFVDAADIRVAVLDSGIDTAHPDLNGRVASYVHAHPDLPKASSPQDLIGHGTHVSGTICALIDNDLGINGICDCRLMAWKIFDDTPDPVKGPFGAYYLYFVDPVMYLRALFDCVAQKPHVLNLSIGGTGKPSDAEAEAFRLLLAGGTTVVAAMGNSREEGSPISYPAAIPGVLAVGATGITDRVARFSNSGNHIALSAPGEAIWSTLPTYPGQSGFDAVPGPNGRLRQGKPRRRETDYDAWPGTSMAAPHVTAAVALYLANGGGADPSEIRQAFAATCDKVPGMAGQPFHPDYGYGRLNLLALLDHVHQARPRA